MSSAANAVLEVSNLRKSFGGIAAVDDVSFDVREGEIFGLIGRNGERDICESFDRGLDGATQDLLEACERRRISLRQMLNRDGDRTCHVRYTNVKAISPQKRGGMKT